MHKHNSSSWICKQIPMAIWSWLVGIQCKGDRGSLSFPKLVGIIITNMLDALPLQKKKKKNEDSVSVFRST